MRKHRLPVICGIVLASVPVGALADPLATMQDVGAAITSCWKPPEGVKKSAVTLSFSLKRDGSLIGMPQPTAITVNGDDDARKSFVDAAVAAVVDCTPVELAPALAAGIGGQVFTLAFTSRDMEQPLLPAN